MFSFQVAMGETSEPSRSLDIEKTFPDLVNPSLQLYASTPALVEGRYNSVILEL